MLLIEIHSAGGTKRQVVIRREGGIGKFLYDYIAKDTPGLYSISLFGSRHYNSNRFFELCRFTITTTSRWDGREEVPINSRIMKYVAGAMGKTIGRGECWDLAQAALDSVHADWKRPLDFGRKVNPDREKVLPGDIIQFKRVVLKKTFPNGSWTRTTLGAPLHTAVIVKVYGPNHYRIAHQNVGGKRYVMEGDLDLNDMTSGWYGIYRPLPGLIEVK
jgi:hypothetical protein